MKKKLSQKVQFDILYSFFVVLAELILSLVICALKNPNLRRQSEADEKTKADLRAKNINHIKDKNSLRRQLKDVREKYKKLENKSITKEKKKEIVKEMLRYSIYIRAVSSH